MRSRTDATQSRPYHEPLCRDAVPTLPIGFLVNWPTGQPVNWVTLYPRVPSLRLRRKAQSPANQRSASMAARQPMPAAVMAWR